LRLVQALLLLVGQLNGVIVRINELPVNLDVAAVPGDNDVKMPVESSTLDDTAWASEIDPGNTYALEAQIAAGAMGGTQSQVIHVLLDMVFASPRGFKRVVYIKVEFWGANL
jgi:hypothetical protein